MMLKKKILNLIVGKRIPNQIMKIPRRDLRKMKKKRKRKKEVK